jgi:hypothetical protein
MIIELGSVTEATQDSDQGHFLDFGHIYDA